MRRSFAALLAVLAAVSALAGCGTKKPGGTKTSDDGYTAEYVPEISRGDYNGASVTVMCRDPEMARGEMAAAFQTSRARPFSETRRTGATSGLRTTTT